VLTLGSLGRVLRAVRRAVREELRPDGPLYPHWDGKSDPFRFGSITPGPPIIVDLNLVVNGSTNPEGWIRG